MECPIQKTQVLEIISELKEKHIAICASNEIKNLRKLKNNIWELHIYLQ